MRTQEKRGRSSTTAVAKEDVCMAGFSRVRTLCKGLPIVKLPISLSARSLRDTKARTKDRVEREQRSRSTERGKNKRRTASGPVGR